MRGLVLMAVMGALLAGCGGNKLDDQSSQVTSAIGATSCAATRYYLERTTDNSRILIYNCKRNGKTICVTEENGIASDSTAAVRLVFADSLSGKPSCLVG